MNKSKNDQFTNDTLLQSLHRVYDIFNINFIKKLLNFIFFFISFQILINESYIKINNNYLLLLHIKKETLSSLLINKNENIIKFYEMLTSENNYYFVYEYCNGGNMEE